jgi:outer membrane protein OmpA-like peptidoglycan-associated protein
MASLRRVARRLGALVFLSSGFAFAATPAGAEEAEVQVPSEDEDGDTCIGKARLRGLAFDQNDSVLDGEDSVILDLVAEVIRERCSGRTIVIEGHTDVWGDAEYNRRLSERRAESVKEYLVERGIPAEQLRVEGFGADRPITTDPSRKAQALNRRVTLRAEPAGR